jgi:hypothetical protein
VISSGYIEVYGIIATPLPNLDCLGDRDSLQPSGQSTPRPSCASSQLPPTCTGNDIVDTNLPPGSVSDRQEVIGRRKDSCEHGGLKALQRLLPPAHGRDCVWNCSCTGHQKDPPPETRICFSTIGMTTHAAYISIGNNIKGIYVYIESVEKTKVLVRNHDNCYQGGTLSIGSSLRKLRILVTHS